ncbi:MAG TPA: alpha-L-fucosidase [Blastocatellia bacterium]|nr:alpha-L-fucosidase [Blastocatellia bacterium]
MSITRRDLIRALAGIAPALKAGRILATDAPLPRIQAGSFEGSRESLKAYQIPAWFRDAKFGIWAHWGPQSAPEYGDWYARNMYLEGHRQYKYHVEKYGHPSKFGFKDVIPTWRADRFDPDYLMSLYQKAGAKYFVSMGVHHDNFDLWNSRHNRWNSVQMGPRKDIVGLFRKAALKHGLRFGVSDHLWVSYKWFSVSHGSDQQGALAGVPYDGADPKYADLYHDGREVHTRLAWNEEGIPEAWKRHWFERIKDLVDQYQPDLLYCDGHLPFEQWGLDLVAHLYNRDAKRRGGKVEAVYTSKRREDSEVGTCVFDVERGVVEGIWPRPWQTDTCVGDWHYNREAKYKSPKIVIDMLVDIVSRNGNLLLNFPLPNSGMPDAEELKILDEITRWMAVNGEAIYATRPWKIFGEGPGTQQPPTNERFNERNRKPLTAEDVRFTTRNGALYAFFMGWPERQAVIAPLATAGQYATGKINKVELLGFKGKVQWVQDEAGLKVQLPNEKPCEHACALKITGLQLT